MTTRRKVILSIIGVIAFLYLGVYTVLTPFIRGVVVDEATKQPVENAWVMATASIGSRTIAGDVGGTYAISRRHLRTGKDGVFYIFPKLYLSFPTPYTFGTMKKRLNLTVRVMDGKRAEVNLSKYWWVRLLFATIPVKQIERTDETINNELRILYRYCIDGKYFPISSKGSERCDAWELDYTIAEHERVLKKISQSKDVYQKITYSGILRVLSRLHQQKSDYRKALEYLITARDFDLQQRHSSSLHNYDIRIKELQDILRFK